MTNKNTMITSGLTIPDSVEEVLDPKWLTAALAPVSGNSPVISVELNEVVKAMAAKVRIRVRFANEPNRTHYFCVKGFLDTDQDRQSSGESAAREALVYNEIAPKITMRTPSCPSAVMDDTGRGILIMEDLIEKGATFCDTHTPFTVEQVQATLDQLARLHAGSHLLERNTWIPRDFGWLVNNNLFPQEWMQGLMHDGRGNGLSEETLDAGYLISSVRTLAQRSMEGQQTILHGDAHIANVYMTDEGPGFADWQLVVAGNWAVDIAYHINCVLPVEVAEKHERDLVNFYLDALGEHGGTPIKPDQAWDEYCCATPYGYLLWAITVRVEQSKTIANFQRLGAAVSRSDAYRRLGVLN